MELPSSFYRGLTLYLRKYKYPDVAARVTGLRLGNVAFQQAKFWSQ